MRSAGPIRRVRAYPGLFALVGALALVAALLITGMPRLANKLADEGLRELVAAQKPAVRDITYRESPDPTDFSTHAANRAEQFEERLRAMPPAVRDVVGERWYAAQTGPLATVGPDLRPGPPLELILRGTTGGREAVTLVDGRWPAEVSAPDAPLEAAVSRGVADGLGLRVGSRLSAEPKAVPRAAAPVTIVGVFEPVDPTGGVWDVEPSAFRVIPPPPDANQGVTTAVALTSASAMASVETAHWPMHYTWRYRVAPERLDAAAVPAVIDGLRELVQRPESAARLVLGLDAPFLEFQRTFTAARTVLAVVTAGVLATLGGLVVLAAGLGARRRAEELALLRARGGAVRTVAGRSLAEALLVVPVAVLAGWLAGQAVPGRSGGTGEALLVAAALVALAMPVAAVAAVARPATGDRRDVLRMSASTRRLTAEVCVVLLAVLGVLLLRRRGLPADGEVDPLLAAVPVLVAVAAALVALRGYPWPLRLASRLSARARGTVPFLGLARAGRATAAGPLVVVVMGVATAAFCGVVAGGVADGRDRAAGLAVPADAVVTGDLFAPDTADALAALPGVRAVAPMVARPAQELRGPDARDQTDPVYLLVVDGPALARTAAESGAVVDLPEVLTAAPAAGPAPAVVSPAVAADLAGEGTVVSAGRRLTFRVAAVRERFASVGPLTDRFVVLSRQALPAEVAQALVPSGFLVAGGPPDRAELQRVGDEGQRRFVTTGLVTGTEPARPSTVTTRDEVRTALGSGGANGVLLFGFAAGVSGGAALGLLAIAFVVLAGARDRGRVLSRLRTMGLSRPQWRGLLVIELAPLVGAAVLTGAVVGVLLPLLLTPALGLSTFTAQLPVRVGLDVGLAAGVVGLGALALATAIAVEAVVNRRLRLGEVLRLGEGN